MRIRVLAVAVLVAASLAIPLTHPAAVGATDISSWCKWGYPWPAWVSFYIHDFYGDTANRVEYGAHTWAGANFNFVPYRDYNSNNPNRIFRGPMSPGSTGRVAETRLYTEGGSCSAYPGKDYRQIYRAETIFNVYTNFHADCNFPGTDWCAANNYFDLHNVSAHEFSHWFWLYDSPDPEDTANGGIAPGEIKKRDLNWHDRQSAHIMYGCRNGGTTYYC